MHSFTADLEAARECLRLGLHISFAGMVTFKKSDSLREVARHVPDDRILIETDSPYLVPQNLRAKTKRNEPLFVIETAKVLAEIKKAELGEVAAVTGENYRALILKQSAPL